MSVWKRELKVQLCLVVAFVFAVYLYIIVTGTPTSCYIRQQTGIPCPFCGGTRAVRALLEFNFISAWNYNPYVFVLPVWVVCVLIAKVRKNKLLWLISSLVNILLLITIYIVRWRTGVLFNI